LLNRAGGNCPIVPTLAARHSGRNAGKHLDTDTWLKKLRNLGVNILGARNSALQNLVSEIPPPVVAHLLGYSHDCTQHHTSGGSGLVTIRHLVAAKPN
jgi:hypothetical protein